MIYRILQYHYHAVWETDNINLVNSINTNLKHKSNVVDINIKNLNITNESIQNEVKNILLTNINNAIPKTTSINDVKFVNYKKWLNTLNILPAGHLL